MGAIKAVLSTSSCLQTGLTEAERSETAWNSAETSERSPVFFISFLSDRKFDTHTPLLSSPLSTPLQ